MMDFPIRPDQVSGAWLAQVFGVDEADVGEVVVAQVGDGVGFTSDTCLIRTSGGNGVPARMFAKFAIEHAEAAAMTRRYQLFQRESAFYDELAPRLPIRTPLCHFTAFDEDTECGVILLADCSDCEMRSQIDEQPTTLEELDGIIDVLARLNAQPDDPNLTQFDWLWGVHNPLFADFFGMIGDNWKTFVESPLFDLLPAGMGSLYERMPDVYAPLVAKHWARDGLGLCHFDYRIDNLFLDPGADDPVIVFDWQAAALGRAPYDLAYLLMGGYSPEFRRAHERELVRLLCERMAMLGRIDYDFDTAWQDYRFGAFFNQWAGPQIATNLDYSSDRAMDLVRVLIPRMAHQFADQGGGELLDELERSAGP